MTTADFCGGELAAGDRPRHGRGGDRPRGRPGAQLYLICFDTEVDLASAEAYAKAQGIKIINHSVELVRHVAR